jgi:3-oxoacyl-[acyl-carrier-protein] synthase III
MAIAHILSTGRAIPERRVDNAELERIVGQPFHDWLVANVGIRARHFMAEHETTSDLIASAAREALARAALSPRDVDLVIVATDTPDQPSPSTAAVVQHKLGAHGSGVFDVNSACAGWVTALDIGARWIATDDDVRHVLVCGGYGMSRFIDFTDKTTATLFADGAGAVVLRAGDRPGFCAGKLVADGQYHDALGIYTGGTTRPATAQCVATSGPPAVKFVRKFPATFNAEKWPPLVRTTLAKADIALEEVELFVFTQLNARTIETVMDNLGVSRDRTHMVMDKWGYLGSACIPVALDDALQQRTVPDGAPVVFCATGGGLAMACSVWRHVRG